MPNVYKIISFDGLPAALITDTEKELIVTAPAIPGLEKGQEVVFFFRTHLGHGIAVYLSLEEGSLKQPMELVVDKSQLPKTKELHIDYGAYVSRRAVHRSAVAYYPARESAAQG
ncbi:MULTISPECIES: hypothetical protein [Pseudomonas]|jgi:hypothetical protein|uniref:Uncharacterized protein n=1 Tax=Pseudomonas grimontii TaxID=129847 RepID=A0A1H1H8M5_9PSED|nr:hypothetical protein [Pseudomonas grimontii]MCS3515550.1 hypothetical protein [Pseudomonas grimontii]TWR67167.1 hypothetical protein FIV39_10735 [Pseudomonas grimontii]SDR21436.1 hypothetical protein SAMN04490186_4051 [Pseudomonas grimontii]